MIGSSTSGRNVRHHAYYKFKCGAGRLNSCTCLSVYCNGQKLANFTSYSSTGSTKMTLEDLSPIALFILCRHRMTEMFNEKILYWI